MRRRKFQRSLHFRPVDHPHAAEVEAIAQLLEAQPGLRESVGQDLRRGVEHPETGAPGMSPSQVLRALLVMRLNDFSFRELAFHLADSRTYRRFCGFGAFEDAPSRSTLAENIGKLRADTLAEVNRAVVAYALEEGVEDGRRVRGDAMAIEADIHPPSDSHQLWDGVRVVTRLLKRAGEAFGFEAWSDHTLRARRRMWEIRTARGRRERKRRYRDLLTVARWARGYAERAVLFLEGGAHDGAAERRRARRLAGKLRHFAALLEAVIDQAERRVLHGEQVPAEEKVLSLFEPHTALIVKDNRDVHYGHKVYLTGGASGLIFDCQVARGNPADSTRTVPLVQRHRQRYGVVPEQLSLDGGFASRENLERVKALGVKDVVFRKKRGLKVSEMVRESWMYRTLRKFRAGIEGVISFLKHGFGLRRCPWHGFDGFRAYVQGSVLAANLLVLARHRMA